MLELRLGDMRHTFDLSSDSTDIAISGAADAADWAMIITRRGLTPIQLDSSTVEPATFTAAIAHWRPDLVASEPAE